MNRFLFFLAVIIPSCLSLSSSVYAQSEYVLPYPADLPGTRLYKFSKLFEKASGVWHFGNLSQFSYNLKYSDKYLVEAKTLFEYDQYLLGYNALVKSNEYWAKTAPFLQKAKQSGINVSSKIKLLQNASVKHIEVLQKLKTEVPKDFLWQPEKALPTKLNIHKLIDDSIQLRNK